MMGLHYSGGLIDKNEPKAEFLWYTKSADNGDSYGQWKLAERYYLGDSVKKDLVMCFDLCLKSSKQVNDYGHYAVSTLLRLGHGVKQDLAKSEDYKRKSGFLSWNDNDPFTH